jgi:hypothetical protein
MQLHSGYQYVEKVVAHLDQVLAGDGLVVPLAVLGEAGNGNAAVVVGATGGHEGVADRSAVPLEATCSASVDDNVGLELVDGVECGQSTCIRRFGIAPLGDSLSLRALH